MYRAADGLKCAAGCLIPDELYNPVMEGQIVDECSQAGKAIIQLGHDLKLVEELQLVHDSFAVEEWEPRLAYVAGKYGLLYSD